MEAIGVHPFRTQVKRRKAYMVGESAHGDEAQSPVDTMRVLATGWMQSLPGLTRGDLLGSAHAVGPRTERDEG